MGKPYSQSKALWAITRASFKAIFAQPTNIVFGLLFPIIFILIFGAFENGGGSRYSVALSPDSDTSGQFYAQLKKNPQIRIVKADTATISKQLVTGDLVAILSIHQQTDSSHGSHYNVGIKTSSASGNNIGGLTQALDYFRLKYEEQLVGDREKFITIEKPVTIAGKKRRQIDFILPGQLGFSILFSTLFGIAFTFFTLREQLVLKRFYASPVRKLNILIGIGVSRLFFQLMNVVVLIVFGHFFLHFTLVHGALTFIELILLSIIMLFLLMGVGLIFSNIVKTDAIIPLLINVFAFPQMLLSGTFFSVTVFPKWLQEICYWLPLTQFNNGTRKISFEGLHLFDLWREIGILGGWIVIIYIILLKVIRWE
ncbi:MAG: ABC transporter permease [Chitinophagaceae bacterium]